MIKIQDTITTFDDPGYKMAPTSHGECLNYLQWCRAEADRITAGGSLCGIVWSNGKCAIAELKPAKEKH